MPQGKRGSPKKSPGLISAERKHRDALRELASLKQAGVARQSQITRAQNAVDTTAERLRSIRQARGSRK